MTSDKEIITALRHYGHFRGRVAEPRLSLLSLRDQDTVEAMRSYQKLLSYSLDPLTRKHHGRASIADGIVGPATRELFALPRCEVPDYGHFATADGSGSWPAPCKKAGVKFHVNKSGMPSAITAKWPAIQLSVVSAYASVGLRLTEVITSDQANILTSFTSFFGSTIGIAEFNGESCSDRVTCRLSRSYVGANASLLMHEWGHNNNLSHTRGGIMNPSILPDPVPFGWSKSDPSYSALVRYFGGVPIDGPAPPPGPGPPPPPGPDPSPRPILDFIRWLFGW